MATAGHLQAVTSGPELRASCGRACLGQLIGRIDSIRSRLTGAINRQRALLGQVSIDLDDPRLALPPD